MLSDRDREAIEAALPDFVGRQRWFFGKSEEPGGMELRLFGALPQDTSHHLAEVVVRRGSDEQRYLLPLSARFVPAGDDHAAVAPHTLVEPRDTSTGAIVDGARDPALVKAVLDLMGTEDVLPLGAGRLEIRRSKAGEAAMAAILAVRPEAIVPISGEQSNTSIRIGTEAILKFYRRLRDGVQPELEVTRFLTDKTDFTGTPALLASAELVRETGVETAVAALFRLVENQGDAWAVVTEHLAEQFREAASGKAKAVQAKERAPTPSSFAHPGAAIGRRTGAMHAALATVSGDPLFDPEPIGADDLRGFVDGARREARSALDMLSRFREAGGGSAAIDRLLGAEAAIGRWFDGFADLAVKSHRTRIHGDYHLGQLLVAGGDVVILDFEGEPGASLTERRAKSSPLRDVAGMLRSFDYAAFAALDKADPAAEATAGTLHAMAESWRDEIGRAFLDAWQRTSGIDLGEESACRLLDLFLLQKAFYELRYEAASRPAWLSIPLRGILSLLEKRQVLS